MRNQKSYLIQLAIAALFVISPALQAQSIYFQPDVQYVTTGAGTEFDLELRVDAAVTTIRAFQFYVDFDDTKLDTVSVTQGPLLPSSGGGTQFEKYIEDGSLKLQDLVLGADKWATGPGLLATVRFRVLDTGTVSLTPNYFKVRDFEATLIAADAYGATIYIDVPPAPFDLLGPIQGAQQTGLPGDLLSFSWDAATSVYPGEGVTYTFEYSTTSTFDAGSTWTATGIATNSASVDVADLEWGYEGIYYWRVTAIGDTYGFERLADPEYETFDFSYTHVPPEPFDLIAPAHGVELSGISDLTFEWAPSATIIPGDDIDYMFYLSTDPAVASDLMIEQASLFTALQFPIAGWPRNVPLYWKAVAGNNYGVTTESSSIFSFTLLGCCVGRVGDANNSGDDEPTIGDVSRLIDMLFLGGDDLECWAEGDINQSGGVEPTKMDITIGDVSYLIDYLFITGVSLGLPNCL